MMPDPNGHWKKKQRIGAKKLRGTNKSEQLSFTVEPSMREDLVALSYVRGDFGAYAGITRQLLARAIREYIANDLTDDERKEYNKIRQNVSTSLMMRRMELQDRQEREEKRARAMDHEREDVLPD